MPISQVFFINKIKKNIFFCIFYGMTYILLDYLRKHENQHNIA